MRLGQAFDAIMIRSGLALIVAVDTVSSFSLTGAFVFSILKNSLLSLKNKPHPTIFGFIVACVFYDTVVIDTAIPQSEQYP